MTDEQQYCLHTAHEHFGGESVTMSFLSVAVIILNYENTYKAHTMLKP